MNTPMKYRVALLFIAFSSLAFATAVSPNISIVAHKIAKTSEYLIHISNLSKNTIVFSRVELSKIENNIVENYRRNTLCDCSSVCELSKLSVGPWETIDVSWDGNDSKCNSAPSGKYRLQLADTCEYEGCLGSYHISAGGRFEIK